MIQKIKNRFNSLNINSKEVIKMSSATMLVRVVGMSIGVLISVFLGRTIGAKGLGIINLSNQIVNILLILSMFGIPVVVLKEVSIAYSRKNWQHINSIIRTSVILNVSIAIIIIFISYVYIPTAINKVFKEPLLKVPLMIILAAMIFQVFSRIFAAGTNGYRKIWQSSLVDKALSLLIVAIILLMQYIFKYNITIVSVAWSYFTARAIVSFTIGLYWKKIRFSSLHKKFIPKPIIKVALPMLFTQASNVIASNIDILMIGIFLEAEAVGLYSVAIRIAFFSSIFLQVTSSVIAPKVASMYANNQIKELGRMVQNVTVVLFIFSIVFYGFLLLSGNEILSVWGVEFKKVYWPLIILATGQLVAISCGSIGVLLTLCGQEKIYGYLTFSSAIANVLFNIIFIKLWGIYGAAYATALTRIIVNIIGVIIVKRRIGIYTISFTNYFKIKS